MTMTDQDFLEQLQYVMLEPPDGGQSWPSDLWSRDEVIDYVNERQDAFVKATHIRVESVTIPLVIGTSRYTLPANWVATVRVYYQPTVGQKKALTKSSGWEADHGIPTWPTQATPKLYMDAETPTLTLQIAPTPDAAGSLELIYVANCDPIDGDGVFSMTVADEFIPTLKYGALADMFSKIGRAHDPSRAAYCQQRFDLGVDIARTLMNGFTNA